MSKKVLMPWCGVYVGGCKNVRYNHGLHTLCGKECVEDYCVKCSVEISKNGGMCVYGDLSDRLKVGILDFVDNKGKKTVSYLSVMRKLGISREEVEAEEMRLGLKIPECHWIEKKRGRPRKEVEKRRMDENVKKRGRPRKEKEVVNCNPGENLIESLLLESNVEEIEESNEEEEEIEVIKLEFKGITYLKSNRNIIFDINSHDAIGIWNEKKECIDDLPEDFE